MNGREIYWPSRPHARRVERDQRAHLHPRPSRRLRPLGLARQRRLEPCGGASLLPQARAQRPRRERMARRRRPAMGVRHRRQARARRGADRRGRRSSAFRATTTSTARPRKASATTSSRPARASAARRRSPICGPRGGDRTSRSRPTRRRRAITLDGRRATGVVYRQGRPRAHGDGATRGDRRGRRAAVAAAAAALRHRPARAAARLRHPGRSRAAGRRREPAGSSAGARDLPLHEADHDQRHAELLVAHDGDGRCDTR